MLKSTLTGKGARRGEERPLTTFKQVVQRAKRENGAAPATLLEPDLLLVGRALISDWERQLTEPVGPIQRTEALGKDG